MEFLHNSNDIDADEFVNTSTVTRTGDYSDIEMEHQQHSVSEDVDTGYVCS